MEEEDIIKILRELQEIEKRRNKLKKQLDSHREMDSKKVEDAENKIRIKIVNRFELMDFGDD